MIGRYRNTIVLIICITFNIVFTFKHSMSFEEFLMVNIRNRMLQAYMTLVRGLTCLKKTCETLGCMEIIVFKIPPGEEKPYLSHGLVVFTK